VIVLVGSGLAIGGLLRTAFGGLEVLGGRPPNSTHRTPHFLEGLMENKPFRAGIIQILGPFEINVGHRMGRGEIVW